MKAVPIKTLDELVESGVIHLTRGKVISKKDIAAWPGQFPIYSSAKDNDGKFGEYGKFLFDEELITWSVDGGGRLFHRPKHKFSVTNVGGILRIRDRNILDYRYLYYVLSLRHSEVRFDWVRKAHPSVIKKIYTDIPVPSLPEQRRIVGILDEAFAGIATAKANAEKNLQNARALFESHLQAVFTQRGEGWVETTLGEVCEFIGGSQPPKSVFSKAKSVDNIRLIQIRDYKSDNHVVYIPRAQARRFCNADDVMIGRYGPPLFQILRGLEGAYNVALMKAVADEKKLSRDFLFYFLKHSTILQYIIYHSARAAGQIGITKETLEPYPIALPCQPDQKKVVDTIKELESETQRLESLYQRKLAALDELKKSLLHRAFSGEL